MYVYMYVCMNGTEMELFFRRLVPFPWSGSDEDAHFQWSSFLWSEATTCRPCEREGFEGTVPMNMYVCMYVCMYVPTVCMLSIPELAAFTGVLGEVLHNQIQNLLHRGG